MPKQYDVSNNEGGDNIMTMMGNNNNNNNHHHDERLLHSPTMFTATNNIATAHDNITDGWTNYTPHRHQTNQNRIYNTNNSHQTNAAKKLPLRNSGRKFTVANTNYNTDMLGGDDAFNNRNRDSNNRNNNMNATDNLMMRMEHRDSILGISGKFHPLQEDVELLNFNHRRGSMGSLSEGLNAGGNANNMDGPLLMNDDCDLLANGGGDGINNNNNDAGNSNNNNAGNNINNANGNSGTNINNTQTKTHHRPVTNTNYNDPSFHQEEQQIQYLAARARRAQMIAVQESRKLEENLRRLEMRRMMMVRERLQRERLQQQQQQQRQQQQQQGGSQQANQQQQGNQNEQQQPQRQGNQNSNRTGHIPRKVNETNYKTMNPTAPPSPAHDVQTNLNYGQTNNPTQMTMAQNSQQQQFNAQFQNNQMMNQNNHMGVHNAMNVPYFNQAQHHNMNGYMPTMPVPPAASENNNGGSKAVTVPNDNSNAKKAQTQQPSQTTPTPIPSAPRRPLSAYNIFFSEIRNELLKESDDNDGEAANENNDEDENDDDNANDAATKENNEQTTNEPTDKPTQDNVTTTTNNTTTDKNKQFETFAKNLAQTRLTTNPKKRIHRKTHGKIQFVSLAKLVGQKWRALPDVQRKKYQDLAMVDKARYKREKMEVVEALRVEAKRLRKIERDRVLLNM